MSVKSKSTNLTKIAKHHKGNTTFSFGLSPFFNYSNLCLTFVSLLSTSLGAQLAPMTLILRLEVRVSTFSPPMVDSLKNRKNFTF